MKKKKNSASNGEYFKTKGNLFMCLLRLRRLEEAISDRMVSSGRLLKIDSFKLKLVKQPSHPWNDLEHSEWRTELKQVS